MEDKTIIDLYWKRSEEAITQTDVKYGRYCYSIAYNVLTNQQDAEESVSDTYMAAWNHIPPARPAVLATFLGRITRNISISRWRAMGAQRRGGGETAVAFEELQECVSGKQSIENDLIAKEALKVLNRFLETLPKENRIVFMRRYWYLDPIANIAANYGFSQSKVKTMLCRDRKQLKQMLKKEGYV